MGRTARRVGLTHLAWVGVGLFWFVTTRHYHPTTALAVIVTVALVAAFAAAADLNHLVLIPRYWRPRRYAASPPSCSARWPWSPPPPWP